MEVIEEEPPSTMVVVNTNRNLGESFFASSHPDEADLLHEEKGPERAVDSGSSFIGHWVTCSKVVVFIVLLSSAAAVGYFAWFVLSEEEQDDFTAQFDSNAKEVIDNSIANAQSVKVVVDTITGLFASYSQFTGATFPNFTLPDFEAFASQTRSVTGILLLAYAPLVDETARTGWEAYSVASKDWIVESHEFAGTETVDSPTIVPYIYKKIDQDIVAEDAAGPYSPVWQLSPPPLDPSIINFNLFSQPSLQRLVQFASFSEETVISEVLDPVDVFGSAAPAQDGEDPQSIMVVPVRSSWQGDVVVGHIVVVLSWKTFFVDLLQPGEGPVFVVMRDSCGSAFTYRADGINAVFMGLGDFHDTAYDQMAKQAEFLGSQANSTGISASDDHCQYTIDVYPSSEMEESFQSRKPIRFSSTVVGVFFLASFIFVVYDCLVQRRQKKTYDSAQRATSIVRSLFPHKVAERLNQQKADEQKRQRRRRRNRTKNIDEEAGSSDESEELIDSKPMAELFPSATVLFADIAGFTAWSSSREPEQVFVLLENLYRAFDKIAVKRKIFKVETIGDCYLAVCGLPVPNEEHAIAMCRFAVECQDKMKELRSKLESKLGPDTGDLALRIGLHSGPVTAGVLRGDRARFQLFGDTVNTASRMESTGVRDKVHISADTARHLAKCGKSHWYQPREDKVVAKGKGEMDTYWLLTSRQSDSEGTKKEGPVGADDDLLFSRAPYPDLVIRNEKFKRMIDWNCEILLQMLRNVVAGRPNKPRRQSYHQDLDELGCNIADDSLPYEEVSDNIRLPDYDAHSSVYSINPDNVVIDDRVVAQMHDYVTVIASMYRDNPFHSFEHASHVSMSAVKLLSRVIGPLRKMQGAGSGSDDDVSSEFLHQTSFGITSDPLTQFTVVLAAVVHDVDHRGVPNDILATEDPSLRITYHGKSLAEQNSVDVAWRVLMSDEFRDLRHAIFTTPSELRRFRQILINTVMATDIFDEDMAEKRQARWSRAFGDTRSVHDSISSTASIHHSRANVVLEYVMQASDMAHTMQHWHVYRKWNERLFREMYKAYQEGRVPNDPADTWYESEIAFFDNYALPLAERLRECGAFGVSSDEYVTYVEKNREEWQAKGIEVVKQFRAQVEVKLERARRQSAGMGR